MWLQKEEERSDAEESGKNNGIIMNINDQFLIRIYYILLV